MLPLRSGQPLSPGPAPAPKRKLIHAADLAPPAGVGLPETTWQRIASALKLAPIGREMDILRCLADGMSNDAIAAALQIEICTVREYVARLFRAIGCHNRAGAVGTALRAMGRMMDKG